MQWAQIFAPVLAIAVVLIITALGVVFVSAIEAFKRAFGPDTEREYDEAFSPAKDAD